MNKHKLIDKIYFYFELEDIRLSDKDKTLIALIPKHLDPVVMDILLRSFEKGILAFRPPFKAIEYLLDKIDRVEQGLEELPIRYILVKNITDQM